LREYEQLQIAARAELISRKLQHPAEDWADADDFGLRLAADRLTRARKSAGLTQEQLAARLKMPQSQVSRIERNPDRTTVRTLKRIAKALRVDVSALI
jgi:ribosome-binding protein aMBF1 (putative translation factor)